MLQALHVRNFAVIADAALELDPSLTVLTGETGAGKSILIGALQLLLGDRASSDQVRGGEQRASVQGTFTIPEGHPVAEILEEQGIPLEDGSLIIRREVSAGGRSRVFLNDTAVTVGSLREIGGELVDLHGQHEHQSLLHVSRHMLLLDEYAGLTSERNAFSRKLTEYRGVIRRLEELRAREEERREKEELYSFQLKEIDALDPTEGEEEKLDREVRILEGAEQLVEGLSRLIETLSEEDRAIIDTVEQQRSVVGALAGIDEGLADTSTLLGEALVALQEAVHFASRYLDEFEFDEERLDQARTRLSSMIHLAKKYGGSVDALLQKRLELKELLKEYRRTGEETKDHEEEAAALRGEVAEMAFSLSGKRSASVDELQERVESELSNLAMPQAEFRVVVEQKETPDGLIEGSDGRRYEGRSGGVDRVEFRLKTDPGTPLLPLQRVASGGEVSRIMLALKSVFGKASRVPTLVFDEIDSGIGGITADRVGEKLTALADEHQVLVITHLPQIARRGRLHLVVEKEIDSTGAQARIRRVEGEERTRALAVLMSGEAESEAVLEHARELLGVSNKGEGEE